MSCRSRWHRTRCRISDLAVAQAKELRRPDSASRRIGDAVVQQRRAIVCEELLEHIVANVSIGPSKIKLSCDQTGTRRAHVALGPRLVVLANDFRSTHGVRLPWSCVSGSSDPPCDATRRRPGCPRQRGNERLRRWTAAFRAAATSASVTWCGAKACQQREAGGRAQFLRQSVGVLRRPAAADGLGAPPATPALRP